MAEQMEAHLHEESKLWSFLFLCQKSKQECKEKKQRKESNMKKSKKKAAIGHISSTFWSPYYTYYISFRSSGSQKSNTSNGVQIRAETKKLWPLEDNYAKMKDNFASCFAAAKPPAGTLVPLRKFKFCFRTMRINL